MSPLNTFMRMRSALIFQMNDTTNENNLSAFDCRKIDRQYFRYAFENFVVASITLFRLSKFSIDPMDTATTNKNKHFSNSTYGTDRVNEVPLVWHVRLHFVAE